MFFCDNRFKFCRRTAVKFFKTAGKIPLVFISALLGNILDFHGGILEKKTGFFHALSDQVFIKIFSCIFFKQLPDVADAEVHHFGNAFNGEGVILQVFFNVSFD